GRSHSLLTPQLTAREVQMQLNHHSLFRLQFDVDSLALRQGRLVWPILGSNQATRQLSVDSIQTQLRFLPGDQWALDHFTAKFAGATVQLFGNLTNASSIRDWGRAQQAAPAGLWQNRLRQLADALERIHFA